MKVILAKVKVNGRSYIVCETTFLENQESTNRNAIIRADEVCLASIECGEVLNPTNEFVADLERIIAKKAAGDEAVYFRGDYGKYYLTDYYKVNDMYNLLRAKAS